MPILDWTNENKQEAFSEWVDFMNSYFIINNVVEEVKHNLHPTEHRTKGLGGHKIAKLTTEQEENSVNMFQIFETHMVQKPNESNVSSLLQFNRTKKQLMNIWSDCK